MEMEENLFVKPEYNGKRFKNPSSFVGWTGLPNVLAILRWMLEPNSGRPPSKQVLDETLPVYKPSFDVNNSSLQCTWLGHATVLVHLDGINFITDPVWSDTASPFRTFGPKRYRQPPCSIDDLPDLDFAVISHNHYDHFDAEAIQSLNKRFKRMQWYVPSGLKTYMHKYVPVENVHELSWGESKNLVIGDREYYIHCVPAQHWSQRGLFDRYKTLWSGWVVVGPTKRFYFAGDTGYCDEFRKIKKIFGQIDLATLPIGCYSPRWFMKPQHIDPAEAVQIHKDIGSKKSIGIHWGTYAMGSTEAYLEPADLLRDEVKKAGLNVNDFIVLHHGQTWTEVNCDKK